MKTLVFYICVFSFVPLILAKVTPKRPGEKHEFYTICLNNNNMSRDEMFTIQEMIDMNIGQESVHVEGTKKNGCVYQCMLEKMGVMEGSEFKMDEIRTKFAEHRPNNTQDYERIMLGCLRQANEQTDKCEKSFILIACYTMTEEQFFLRPFGRIPEDREEEAEEHAGEEAGKHEHEAK